MSPSADRLPACPECTALPPDDEGLDVIRQLKSEELATWLQRIVRIDRLGHRHVIDPAGLRGEYHAEKTIKCSYLEHRHKHGYAVVSRCGLPLIIGSCCGRKYILNYGRFRRALVVAQKVEAEVALQRTEPQRLERSFSRLTEQASRLLDGLDALRDIAPEVYKQMLRAYSRSEYRVWIRERHFNPETLQVWYDERCVFLEGLQLFSGRFSRRRLQELRNRAAAYALEAPVMTINLQTYEEAKRLRSRMRSLADDLQRWLDEASMFWKEANLELALRKTYGHNVPGYIKVRGQTIMVRNRAAGLEGALR